MDALKLEEIRKKARNRVLVGIFITIILVICSLMKFGFSSFSFIFPLIVGITISALISVGPSNKFSSLYKETYVHKSLESVFDDLVYYPDRGINSSVIADTGMMYMGDRYNSNDYVSGKYKNINVIQSDIHIEKKEVRKDSDGNIKESWVTIFRGKWMVFDFNKEFKANIQVKEKGFSNSKLGSWFDDSKYKKVVLEDQDFNDRFIVYAQDEHEAFYILTPLIMDRMKTLSSNIKGSLLFCFVNNKLHVGIQNNSDSFEHSIFTKIDEEKIINSISKEIKDITDFIDELNLDNDLFKKEV
jgi:hypothetical protein